MSRRQKLGQGKCYTPGFKEVVEVFGCLGVRRWKGVLALGWAGGGGGGVGADSLRFWAFEHPWPYNPEH